MSFFENLYLVKDFEFNLKAGESIRAILMPRKSQSIAVLAGSLI